MKIDPCNQWSNPGKILCLRLTLLDNVVEATQSMLVIAPSGLGLFGAMALSNPTSPLRAEVEVGSYMSLAPTFQRTIRRSLRQVCLPTYASFSTLALDGTNR